MGDSRRHQLTTRFAATCAGVLLVAGLARGSASVAEEAGGGVRAELQARAVLPAGTFASGPPSGALLGNAPINGEQPPFPRQPVQGFSALLAQRDGTYLAMADNGFGALENSADFNLRVYRLRPHFETRDGGSGRVAVLGFIELHDPDRKVDFAIVNAFTPERVLTGADFDFESMRQARDGSLWFGDEFGPFLLHTDASGKVLEPPIRLPDPDRPGAELRSPQNPYNEESSTVRVMNAMRAHALAHGDRRTPVVSPSHLMLADADPTTNVDNRESPPPGSGLSRTSSEVHDVASLHRAGFPVIPYTIDDTPRMHRLLDLHVDGIISDRPDLLYQVASARGLVGQDGLIDAARLDAQGHRGARDLRPENTLPAMEAGLDNLVTTLETDNGVTRDGAPVLSHDPHVQAQKCRTRDGGAYDLAHEVLIKDLTLTELQARFVCDKVFRGPDQRNDRALSPVALAFTAEHGLSDPYVMPTTQQLFDFVRAYAAYYREGAGTGHPEAQRRWRNAERVRFNIETKLNPRTDEDPDHVPAVRFIDRTVGPDEFVAAVAGVIEANGMQQRADIQSFDFRTLLLVQERHPTIRTVCLFGDFPRYADPKASGSDDGTNLQPSSAATTPWLAGLPWPYRSTTLDHPFRVKASGGLEGMALSADGRTLLPMLEKPLAGDDPQLLDILEFDLASRRFTSARYRYRLDARGVSIGDFTMFDAAHGVVIERDDTQGDLRGFKAVYEITVGRPQAEVGKRLAVDLLRIRDPHRISEPGQPGDVGIGRDFAFPFTTIEDVVVLGERRIAVLNDNNFPFSVGRHVGSGRPDDSELIVLKLDEPLARAR